MLGAAGIRWQTRAGRRSAAAAGDYGPLMRADVDSVFAELVAAGYPSQQEPYDAFWGVRYAVVTDPEGNAVALISPVDEALRTAPPAPPPT